MDPEVALVPTFLQAVPGALFAVDAGPIDVKRSAVVTSVETTATLVRFFNFFTALRRLK